MTQLEVGMRMRSRWWWLGVLAMIGLAGCSGTAPTGGTATTVTSETVSDAGSGVPTKVAGEDGSLRLFTARWLAEGARDPFFSGFSGGLDSAFGEFSFNGPELECFWRHVVAALDDAPTSAGILEELTAMALEEPGFPEGGWEAREALAHLPEEDLVRIAEVVLRVVDTCGDPRLGLFGGHMGPLAVCAYDRASHKLRAEVITLSLTDPLSDKPYMDLPEPTTEELFSGCVAELSSAEQAGESPEWLIELEEEYHQHAQTVDWEAHPSTVSRDPAGVVVPPAGTVLIPRAESRSRPADEWVGVEYMVITDLEDAWRGERLVRLGGPSPTPQLENLYGGLGPYAGAWHDQMVSMWTKDPFGKPNAPGEYLVFLWESVHYPDGVYIGEQPWYSYDDTVWEVRRVIDAAHVTIEPNERIWNCSNDQDDAALAIVFGARDSTGLQLVPIDAWVLDDTGLQHLPDPSQVYCPIR